MIFDWTEKYINKMYIILVKNPNWHGRGKYIILNIATQNF